MYRAHYYMHQFYIVLTTTCTNSIARKKCSDTDARSLCPGDDTGGERSCAPPLPPSPASPRRRPSRCQQKQAATRPTLMGLSLSLAHGQGGRGAGKRKLMHGKAPTPRKSHRWRPTPTPRSTDLVLPPWPDLLLRVDSVKLASVDGY